MPLIKMRSSSLIDSIDLHGTPTSSTQYSEIATTQLVRQGVSTLIGSSPELLNTLSELAKSLGTDKNQA
jgi:hypothetical protein